MNVCRRTKPLMKCELLFCFSVKCILKETEVEVSGGGLDATYSTFQLHFHWGDTEHHPGSEHTIDGHRYPMEVRWVWRSLDKVIACIKLCFCFFYAMCSSDFLLDAYRQSEERSFCGAGQSRSRGDRCSWVSHKCMSNVLIF